jgi:hypothetical protein
MLTPDSSVMDQFDGITVEMYVYNHLPPHFHAYYAEHAAVISISDFSVLKGNLPPAQLSKVIAWAAAHKTELEDNWKRIRSGQYPERPQRGGESGSRKKNR